VHGDALIWAAELLVAASPARTLAPIDLPPNLTNAMLLPDPACFLLMA
jgi:hypothetical protein